MRFLFRLTFVIILFMMFGSIAGCNNKKENLQLNLNVEPLDQSGFQQLINQRAGKVLLLNVWATWCVPCREEFPDLIKLAEQYKNSDVEIVGLSVDYPDEIESKISPFLKKQNVNFKIYVQDFSKQEDLIQALNPNWQGAIPATFIYDANATQQAFLMGKHTFDQFKEEIEKVIE